MNCKNCENIVIGKYCSNCGQKSSIDRINFSNVLNEFSESLFHALKIHDQTLAVIKFTRVFNDKVINLILNEKQYYRLEEVEKNLNIGIIKFNMFFPSDNKSKIEINTELGLAKIKLRQRISIEPFVCLIPIILDHYRKVWRF